MKSLPGAGVPEPPRIVIMPNQLGKCFSRAPTINNREEAIIELFKPPQHDAATHMGTKIVPVVPIVFVAKSVATAGEAIISAGVKTAK